jgi:hypothetical protein
LGYLGTGERGGTRTHNGMATATCFQDKLLVRPVPFRKVIKKMGRERLELSTFRLKGDCSDQLSYQPVFAIPPPRLELGSRADLALAEYKSAALPIELQGQSLMDRVRLELTTC